nr:unnamed protein product [Digitaria exilis]
MAPAKLQLQPQKQQQVEARRSCVPENDVGIMGQHLAKASLAAGHPTALLVRPANAADPSKLKLLEALK